VANSWSGCDFKPGKRTDLISGYASNNSAIDWAFATIRSTRISIKGLLGVSIWTALVGLLNAFAQTAGALPFTNSKVTPHFGKNSVITTWHEENIADIPEPVATQKSAPSIAAKRASNMATVGLWKRLYKKWSVSSAKESKTSSVVE